MMLAGKTALVTGAANGIGREIARTFAREGADLALLDVEAGSLEEARAEIEAAGRKAVALTVDVRNFPAVQEAVNKVVDTLGRIDILLNNAGITRDNLLLRMSEAEWDDVIAVNLKGTYNLTRAAARQMLRQRSGRIINIASIIGLVGNVGQVNYAASKAGIIGLTKSAAKEMASRGITVNAIAPGFIDTRMNRNLPDEIRKKMLAAIPLGHYGEPKDVAGAALYLASDLAAYVTGQVLTVDGGMVM